MLYQCTDAITYREQFKKKFNNFGEKAPVILSCSVDEFEVAIRHVNSNTIYKYPWDYTMDIKSFIHKIKQDISYNHYPRISRKENVALDSKDIANLMAQGISADEIPQTKEVVKIYRIDKILAMKDEFVIVDENTGEQYCYKMNSSAVFFLKSYREGKYKDISEAGDVFFEKSTLINKLEKVLGG